MNIQDNDLNCIS